MGNQPKTKPNGGPTAVATRKRFPVSPVIVPAVAAVVLLGLWLNRSQPAAAPKDSRTLETDVTPVAAATPAPKSQRRFQKVVGRWLRPDGGYVIEIKRAADDGKLDAAHFNPNSIHVARAEASREGSALKLFIELRDVNYPGSTYTLAYQPASDQLKGIYYQAALQQRFEVLFERLK